MASVGTYKGMVECLVKSKATGTPDAVAAPWLVAFGDAAYTKLVKVGRAEPRTASKPVTESSLAPASATARP
jgi:hypothetical protein